MSLCFINRVQRFLFISCVLAVFGCDSGTNEQISDSQPHRSPMERFVLNVDPVSSGSTENLLINPFFEDPVGIPGWSECVSSDALQAKTAFVTQTKFIEVGARECILQAVTVVPGQQYSFSCDVRAFSNDEWSGLGLTFYSSEGTLIYEPPTATPTITPPFGDSRFDRAIVKGVAPAGASIGLAWFYTDTGGAIDNCWLKAVPSSQQLYSKTISLEKCRRSSRIGGTDCIGLNGFDEFQRYSFSGLGVSNVIDGFDIPDAQYRDVLLAVGVTDEHLYVNVSFNKGSRFPGPGGEVFTDSYPVNGQLWNDDSFEIYLNIGNESTPGYDSNDFLKAYGYVSPGVSTGPVVFTGENSQLVLNDETACANVGIRGGIACDVRFSLAELGLAGKSIAEIGFDVHANIDDDGGDREVKYSWCSGKTVEAYRDMSTIDCSLTIIQQPEIPHPLIP